MKRTASLIALIALAASLQAQTVRVDVDASAAIRAINPLLYGINTARWDESLFPGPDNEMLLSCDRDAIAKIKASGVTMLKYPGGNDADHYVWNDPANPASEMDTDEYLALCREVGAEPFITVNFNEPPALAAAWVRYCNRERGYRVKYWEVGDEQWGSWAKGHSTPEDYAKKYIEFVKAMKEVDPTILVATNVALTGSSPSLGGQSAGWTERVLRAAGKYVDMLTITFYPQQWGQENDDTLFASTAKYRTLFTALRKEVERIVGKKRADEMVFINVGYNSVNHSGGAQTLQVVNALWTADMLGTMAECGTDVGVYWAVHNYYPPRNGDYGYLSSDRSNMPRYPYYVFPMFSQHFLGTAVAAKSSDPSVAAYAARNGKALSLFLINEAKIDARRTTIGMSGFTPGTRCQAWILDEQRKNVPFEDVRLDNGSLTVNLPPYSLVAIEIVAADSVLPPINLAHLAEAEASSYSTIGVDFGPSSAIDGKLYTKWNSAAWTKSNGEEQQWFTLRWGAPHKFSNVVIRWGSSWATDYVLEVSADNEHWKTVKEVHDGKGGVETLTFDPVVASFVRMNGKHGSKGISAYSICEFEVYE